MESSIFFITTIKFYYALFLIILTLTLIYIILLESYFIALYKMWRTLINNLYKSSLNYSK